MSHENINKTEKIHDMGDGYSIWRVHIDSLRERDKNARIMSQFKFDRLTENIKENGGLFESLPLATPIENKGGNAEFLIISGHHRIRAARSANITMIHVIVIEKQLTKDEIIAKQLSHNALSGEDDQHVLRELYDEIKIIDFKIQSGLTDMEIDIPQTSVKINDIQIQLDYELVKLFFLSRDAQRLDEIFATLEEEAKAYIVDKKDFERFTKQVREIHQRDDIINLAAIFTRMLDIVEHYHSNTPIKPKEDKKKKK